jgi:chromosome segregation ATPase
MPERAAFGRSGNQEGPPPVAPDAQVIDLRDPNVADGLAHALDQVALLSERTGAAEARADVARHERMAAAGQVRRLTADLEHEQAARHRLEIDNAELRREVQLRLEQLTAARADVAATRDQLRRAVSTADREVTQLRSELAVSQRSVHLLEALVGRRKRRSYEDLRSRDHAADNASVTR